MRLAGYQVQSDFGSHNPYVHKPGFLEYVLLANLQQLLTLMFAVLLVWLLSYLLNIALQTIFQDNISSVYHSAYAQSYIVGFL